VLSKNRTLFKAMAETLFIPTDTSKREIYKALFPQIEALIADESDLTANLANITAVLKEAFGFFWVGFYLVKEGQLVLGPFQGPIACTRIPFHKGVCGASYTRAETIIVPDVEQFPGHIACSSASRSEIVMPVFHRNGTVAMVLDVERRQRPARRFRRNGPDRTGKNYSPDYTETLTNHKKASQTTLRGNIMHDKWCQFNENMGKRSATTLLNISLVILGSI
jgi:L-methionine (R)-S-oxide reductase